MLCCNDEDIETQDDQIQLLLDRMVDGLIIAPAATDHGFLLRDREAGMALVFVDRPGRFIDADAVLTDNTGGAEQAVEHLIGAGHRRIAFLGDRPEIHTAAERLRGYERAHERHGIAIDTALVRHTLTLGDNASAATRALLLCDGPPTAIFTSQNLITIDAVRVLHELGLQHRVALVGFDDVELADVVEPGLTVVAQDPAGLGRQAAALLFARLDGDEGPTRTVVVPTTLIARGSGELAP
jgi:LacI family transcriptional regulator